MMRKPIGFGWKTNDRFGPHLYYHSRHSLTWSWIVRCQLVGFVRPSWSWHRNPVGFAIGVPRISYFSTYTTNGARQWQAHVLGAVVSWDRQRPMWFCDLYRRARDRAADAERHLRLMQTFAGLKPREDDHEPA